jgi:hypothetical protein
MATSKEANTALQKASLDLRRSPSIVFEVGRAEDYHETTPDMMFRLFANQLAIYPLERGTKDELPGGGQREKVRDEVRQCVSKAVLSSGTLPQVAHNLWTKGLANSPRTPFP